MKLETPIALPEVFDFTDEYQQRERDRYPMQYKEGFRFATNSPNEDVDRYKKVYQGKGYDVFVGDTATDRTGEIIPCCSVILIRKKK